MSDEITEFNWKLQAVKNIAPNCSFSTDNEGKINWGSGNPLDEPTKAEIDKEIARLKAEYDSKSYARTRQQNFPNEHDLLIALWEKVMEDRSESADALQAIRTQVKSDNPKP